MYFLSYLSNMNPKISEDDLLDILMASRRRNAEKSITGMLMYVEGNVIQAIEGEEHDVIQLFSRIEQDKRHYGIIKLVEGTSPDRIFKGWSMGYKSTRFADLEGLSGLTNISKNTFLIEQDSIDHPAMVVLKSFYDNYK